MTDVAGGSRPVAGGDKLGVDCAVRLPEIDDGALHVPVIMLLELHEERLAVVKRLSENRRDVAAAVERRTGGLCGEVRQSRYARGWIHRSDNDGGRMRNAAIMRLLKSPSNRGNLQRCPCLKRQCRQVARRCDSQRRTIGDADLGIPRHGRIHHGLSRRTGDYDGLTCGRDDVVHPANRIVHVGDSG